MQPSLQQTIDQKRSFIMGLWWTGEGSEHAHARSLDKTRESWRLVGWLDRAMPGLSNNDGLPTSLLRSRPIQQTLCQKKSRVGTQNLIDLKSLLTRVSVRLNIAWAREGDISGLPKLTSYKESKISIQLLFAKTKYFGWYLRPKWPSNRLKFGIWMKCT